MMKPILDLFLLFLIIIITQTKQAVFNTTFGLWGSLSIRRYKPYL